MEIFMLSLVDRLELKTEQEAFKEYEENGKLSWNSLDDWQIRQQFNQIKCSSLLNMFSLVYCKPQVRNEIKLLYNGNILFPTSMNLLPLTKTGLSRALNVTCHLTESMWLCWLKVMFNFHKLFINNQCVSQETNLYTSYLL